MCTLASSVGCSSNSPEPSMEGDAGISPSDADVTAVLRRVDTSLYLPTVTLNAAPSIIILNGLDLGPLNVASIDPTELSVLNSDDLSSSGQPIGDVARKILAYAYSCALPASSSMQLEIGDDTWEFNGLLGLAPEWETSACDTECQEWVSACILSRTNQFGTKVKLSLRGDHPALQTSTAVREQYTLREGSFYGNIFTGADTVDGNAYACAGGAGSAKWEITNRFCSALGDGCPITTVADCNISNFACDPEVDGCSSFTACSDWNDDALPTTCYSEKHACGQATVGTSYSRIITAYLEAPVVTCGDGFCSENEASSCAADCSDQWAVRFGSGCHEDSGGLSLDDTGNIGIVGRFQGDMIMGGLMHSTDDKYDRDLFVASMTPEGAVRWSRSMDSAGKHSMVRSVTHDSSGNLLVAGHFANTTDLGNGPVSSSGLTLFVAKYAAADGKHLWSKTMPMNQGVFLDGLPDIPNIKIVADTSDGFVIAAAFLGEIDLGLPGQQPVNDGNNEDILVARFDASGDIDWNTVLASKRVNGIEGAAIVGGLALDSNDNVVLVGAFRGELSREGTASIVTSSNVDWDGFLVKLSSTGEHQWATTVSGANNKQEVLGVTAGPDGDIVIVGSYIDDTQIAGGEVISSAIDIVEGLLTNPDSFVAAFTTTGEPKWSTHFGAGRSDIAQAVDWDGESSYVVSSIVTSEVGGTVNVAGTVIDAGDYGDIALIRFGSEGVVSSVTHHPTPVTEETKGLVANGSQVTLAGEFMGTLRFGGSYLTNAGGSSNAVKPGDLFVTTINTLP